MKDEIFEKKLEFILKMVYEIDREVKNYLSANNVKKEQDKGKYKDYRIDFTSQ